LPPALLTSSRCGKRTRQQHRIISVDHVSNQQRASGRSVSPLRIVSDR
jgi:hypothetical protein